MGRGHQDTATAFKCALTTRERTFRAAASSDTVGSSRSQTGRGHQHQPRKRKAAGLTGREQARGNVGQCGCKRERFQSSAHVAAAEIGSPEA